MDHQNHPAPPMPAAPAAVHIPPPMPAAPAAVHIPPPRAAAPDAPPPQPIPLRPFVGFPAGAARILNQDPTNMINHAFNAVYQHRAIPIPPRVARPRTEDQPKDQSED